MTVTPGHTGSGQIAGAEQADACPSAVVAPRPLPAEGELLAAEAAVALGWRGFVLPELPVLGRRIHVVAELRTAAHAERIATGMDPVLDRTTVATWTWPELADTVPAPAAEITGVLAVTRHWRTALAWAAPFARYYPAAVVLPTEATVTHDYVDNCLPRARAGGVSICSVDARAQVSRDLRPLPQVSMPDDDPIARWFNELVYEQLLAAAELPAGAH